MNRREAIARAAKIGSGAGISQRNTRFANVNARKSVWWFDIPLAALQVSDIRQLHLLMYEPDTDELHHLDVPVEHFRTNLGHLVTRSDRQTISLELSTESARKFQDVRPGGAGVHFGQFARR